MATVEVGRSVCARALRRHHRALRRLLLTECPGAVAQLTQPPALNQLRRPRKSEQPPAQYANEAEDARTEQQDAAGLRDRGTAIPTAPAGQSESFRRNRAQGVLIGCRRSAVLIPVDRVANRAAGGGASIAQRHKARAARPRNAKAGRVCLVQVITILVSAQEGAGKGH